MCFRPPRFSYLPDRDDPPDRLGPLGSPPPTGGGGLWSFRNFESRFDDLCLISPSSASGATSGALARSAEDRRCSLLPLILSHFIHPVSKSDPVRRFCLEKALLILLTPSEIFPVCNEVTLTPFRLGDVFAGAVQLLHSHATFAVLASRVLFNHAAHLGDHRISTLPASTCTLDTNRSELRLL